MYLLGIKYIFKYLFYIALGNAIGVLFLNKKYQEILSSLWMTIACSIVFISIRVVIIELGYPDEEGPFLSLQNLLITCSTITGLCLLFNISYVLDKHNFIRILQTVGSHSLHILCMHLIVGGLLRFVLLKLTSYQHPTMAYFIACSGAIIIPIIFNNVLERLKIGYFFYPGKDSTSRSRQKQ